MGQWFAFLARIEWHERGFYTFIDPIARSGWGRSGRTRCNCRMRGFRVGSSFQLLGGCRRPSANYPLCPVCSREIGVIAGLTLPCVRTRHCGGSGEACMLLCGQTHRRRRSVEDCPACGHPREDGLRQVLFCSVCRHITEDGLLNTALCVICFHSSRVQPTN